MESNPPFKYKWDLVTQFWPQQKCGRSDTMWLPRVGHKGDMVSAWLSWGPCSWIPDAIFWGSPRHTKRLHVGFLGNSPVKISASSQPQESAAWVDEPFCHPSPSCGSFQLKPQRQWSWGNLSPQCSWNPWEIINHYCLKLLSIGPQC